MIKIIAPIIFFILLIYGISHYWSKANKNNKKQIAIILAALLSMLFVATSYFVID